MEIGVIVAVVVADLTTQDQDAIVVVGVVPKNHQQEDKMQVQAGVENVTLVAEEAVVLEVEEEEVAEGEGVVEVLPPVLNATPTVAHPGAPPTKTPTSCHKTKMATPWWARLQKSPISARSHSASPFSRRENAKTANVNIATSSM